MPTSWELQSSTRNCAQEGGISTRFLWPGSWTRPQDEMSYDVRAASRHVQVYVAAVPIICN